MGVLTGSGPALEDSGSARTHSESVRTLSGPALEQPGPVRTHSETVRTCFGPALGFSGAIRTQSEAVRIKNGGFGSVFWEDGGGFGLERQTRTGPGRFGPGDVGGNRLRRGDAQPKMTADQLLHNLTDLPELRSLRHFQQFEQGGFDTRHTDTGISHSLQTDLLVYDTS